MNGPVHEQYSDLCTALSNLPLYSPLCVNDFAPVDRYLRKVWLSHLALPYPVKEYRYAYGNQLGVVSFLWRVGNPEDESSSAKVLLTVSGQLKMYSTREMRRQFISKYGHINNPSKAVLRQIFLELTNDSSAARTPEEAKIDERIAAALLLMIFGKNWKLTFKKSIQLWMNEDMVKFVICLLQSQSVIFVK